MMLAGAIATGCLAVAAGADRITLGDLAAAFPGVRIEDSGRMAGFAPAPGVQRIFRLPELRRLAGRYRLGEPAGELCLERRLAPVAPERLLAAMSRALPGARIQLLDYSHAPAPEGELEFLFAGLHAAPAGAIWTGAVRYTANRRFAVWARVSVSVPVSRVVAAVDLKPGRAVERDHLREETRDEFPLARSGALTAEDLAGRVALRTVRAGTPLRREWFEAPKDVQRGDRVRVEVRRGGAVVAMDATAESAGRSGQTIAVRNPATSRTFRARIEEKGKVSITP